ncbi:MAG: hypothetical protein ACP5KW_11920 [Thermoproteota archaeon]
MALKTLEVYPRIKVYITTVMFVANIALSFMLSSISVLVGFVGWVITYLVTRIGH